MPRGDGTGPAGMGPITGRGTGFCAGYPAPGYITFAGGRGFWGCGSGFGGGRGWRHWFRATGLPGWMRAGAHGAPYQKPDPELEKQALKNQAKVLQSELEFVKNRLSEVETETAPE
jgi:hypothetical protein